MRKNQIYRRAEKALYDYADMVVRINRKAYGNEEIEAIAYGQGGNGPRVKSSGMRDPVVQAAGKRLPRGLTPREYLWMQAIENAWTDLTHFEPVTAKILEYAYGLSGGYLNGIRLKGRGKNFIRDAIMNEVGIVNNKTYYKKKSEAVNAVIYHYVTLIEK